MTREEAHEKLHFGNKLGYLDFNELHIRIEEIFDDFEEKLEQLQNRSCENCKHSKIEDNVWKNMRCNCDSDIMPYEDGAIHLHISKDFCCNQYEAKDSE